MLHWAALPLCLVTFLSLSIVYWSLDPQPEASVGDGPVTRAPPEPAPLAPAPAPALHSGAGRASAAPPREGPALEGALQQLRTAVALEPADLDPEAPGPAVPTAGPAAAAAAASPPSAPSASADARAACAAASRLPLPVPYGARFCPAYVAALANGSYTAPPDRCRAELPGYANCTVLSRGLFAYGYACARGGRTVVLKRNLHLQRYRYDQVRWRAVQGPCRKWA